MSDFPASISGHLAPHQVDPRPDGLPVESHARDTVDHPIGLVDQMRELMDAHVAFVGRVAEAVDQIRLGQDHQPVQAARPDHPEDVVTRLVAELELAVESGRVDEHLVNLVPLPIGESEDRDDRAGSGQDACRRVDLDANAGDPLLSQEHLELTTEPPLGRRVENPEEDDVPAATPLPSPMGMVPVAQPQSQDPADQPFVAGEPLNLSSNARTYGGFRFAESMSYDEERDLYVAVNAGIAQDVVPNDGYISLVNPDGTAHTLKWIGVNRNGLTLNHPLGSDIINGLLYVVDINVVRWFDMETGQPRGSITVEDAQRFNDLEVAADGTIYATQTGSNDSTTWRIYRITPRGDSSVFVAGPPLRRPNGVAFDPQGNIVVVNVGTNDVLTFSPSGQAREHRARRRFR